MNKNHSTSYYIFKHYFTHALKIKKKKNFNFNILSYNLLQKHKIIVLYPNIDIDVLFR